MKATELRGKYTELVNKMRNILENNGDKVWSKEDQADYDTAASECERVKAQIQALERMSDEDKDRIVADAGTRSGKDVAKVSLKDCVALYLRKGDKVNAQELALIQNAMSTTTGSEGGFTVPTEVAKMVIDALKEFGGMRSIANVVQTAAGNAWQYPASDGTAEIGAIVGENVVAPTGEITFNQVPLVVYKYTSNQVALPWELIQDSAIDVVSFVINRLATRLGRITNAHYTVGTGSGQPFGIVTRATSGRVGTTGQTTTVTYDDLVFLQHSVDPAYRRQGATFMMNDLTVRSLRILKDSQGRPIFVPGYEVSVPGGAPDTLLGTPIIVNQDMPVMAANAKSILYGAKKSYLIRDVMDVEIKRFDDSVFALKGQVGFCGWSRTGGNLLDTSAVKFYQNSAT